ncbi:MAG: SPASM domain-containing protein [Clostridia bacterium]|nr:SPASM domain-containing protein [Clostridia bacterium]
MKKKKAYIEITNACNLACSFCHGTKRPVHYMTDEEFQRALTAADRYADFVYFHLMGEPLLHPRLAHFLTLASLYDTSVIITTNGTLLKKCEKVLLSARTLHKVSISLHAYEANEIGISLDEYLEDCFSFCKKAAERGIIAVLRLWNVGGADTRNEEILRRLRESFPGEWQERYSGYMIGGGVFLEWGERFEWPDIDGEELGCDHTCYGLRDQIGILSDGTVVPCCLDADGAIPLGNIFESSMSDILESPRAVALKRSLQERRPTEALCRRCGYARMKKY